MDTPIFRHNRTQKKGIYYLDTSACQFDSMRHL